MFCALRPTFEKLFRGVRRILHCEPNFDRAIWFAPCAQILWNGPQIYTDTFLLLCEAQIILFHTRIIFFMAWIFFFKARTIFLVLQFFFFVVLIIFFLVQFFLFIFPMIFFKARIIFFIARRFLFNFRGCSIIKFVFFVVWNKMKDFLRMFIWVTITFTK